jgi:general secretion pathway protein G
MHLQRAGLNRQRPGFTLVEMVVVVLIMGIIAAVAMPRMAMSSQTAKNNAARKSLVTIRNAIELYKVDTGANPANAATLAASLKPYLKGPFPPCPLGTNAGSSALAVGTDPPSVVSGGAGWAYVATSGDFYLNDATGINW